MNLRIISLISFIYRIQRGGNKRKILKNDHSPSERIIEGFLRRRFSTDIVVVVAISVVE